MKQKSANSKTSQRNPQAVDQAPSAGSMGMAIAPPAYGIGSVDLGLTEAQASRGTVTQRQADVADTRGDTGTQSENKTGLPDNLKAGIESLSGLALDDVRVHYNSSRPAQLNALAYTQGTEIHLAPGLERLLPHEAWHLVQQAQGRVQPTMQMKDGVSVNDDEGLEHEADVMGAKALQFAESAPRVPAEHDQRAFAALQRSGRVQAPPERIKATSTVRPSARVVGQGKETRQLKSLARDKLNVVGEEHPETDARESLERRYSLFLTGSENYWREAEFPVTDLFNPETITDTGDPLILRMMMYLAWAFHFFDKELNKIYNPEYPDRPLGPLISADSKTLKWMTYFRETWPSFLRQRRENAVHGIYITEFISQTQHVDAINKEMSEFDDLRSKMIKPGNHSEIKGYFYRTIFSIYKSVAALRSAKIGDNIRPLNKDDISEQRSFAMHKAAQSNCTRKGVWKIGDKHVSDINKYGISLSYNLISLEQFNRNYRNFWKLKTVDDLTPELFREKPKTNGL